jgi:hypothetical protein
MKYRTLTILTILHFEAMEIKVAEKAEDAHVESVRFRQSTGCLGRSTLIGLIMCIKPVCIYFNLT